MKFLRIALIVIVALVAIFFVGAMFLPKTYSVSRSINIKAPAAVAYANTGDFKQFLKWNPWTKMEPSAKVTIFGTPLQPEHGYTWKGEETGSGNMKIKSVVPDKHIAIDLTFEEPFESNALTEFHFDPIGNETKVTWAMSGENNSAADKWMSLTMDGMIGKDFESGLKSLKQLSEK